VKNEARRWNILACGRRWGKTTLDEELLIDPMAQGYPVAYFAPTYKLLSNTWREIKRTLAPVTKDKSETEHRIEIITGGVLDCWSLELDRPGVGRKYKRVVVDEAGMAPKLEEQWYEAIRPTLTDLEGDGFFSGTPKGRNFFWRLHNRGMDEAELDYAAWRFPSASNPFLPPAEIETARKDMPDRAFRQEYLAEFIEDGGGVFRLVLEAVDKDRTANEEPSSERQYYLGVDLARVEDFTVLSVLDDRGRQVYFERFKEISWERQIGAITQTAERYQPRVIVDSTGVGDPIFERLRQAGLLVEGFQISVQSKERLIDGLAMAIEQGRLRLMNVPTQTNELQAYQYEVTRTGHVMMNAPSGMHDDTVIGLALATTGIRRTSRLEIGRLDDLPDERVELTPEEAEQAQAEHEQELLEGDEGWV